MFDAQIIRRVHQYLGMVGRWMIFRLFHQSCTRESLRDNGFAGSDRSVSHIEQMRTDVQQDFYFSNPYGNEPGVQSHRPWRHP